MQIAMLASGLGTGTAQLRSEGGSFTSITCCRAAPCCHAALSAREVQPPQSSANALPIPAAEAALRPRRRRRRPTAVEASLSYKDAGVDIDAGNELVRRIKKLNPAIGGFAGTIPHGALQLLSHNIACI